MSGAAEHDRHVPASTRGHPLPGSDGRPWCVDYGTVCGGNWPAPGRLIFCPWCPNDPSRQTRPKRRRVWIFGRR